MTSEERKVRQQKILQERKAPAESTVAPLSNEQRQARQQEILGERNAPRVTNPEVFTKPETHESAPDAEAFKMPTFKNNTFGDKQTLQSNDKFLSIDSGFFGEMGGETSAEKVLSSIKPEDLEQFKEGKIPNYLAGANKQAVEEAWRMSQGKQSSSPLNFDTSSFEAETMPPSAPVLQNPEVGKVYSDFVKANPSFNVNTTDKNLQLEINQEIANARREGRKVDPNKLNEIFATEQYQVDQKPTVSPTAAFDVIAKGAEAMASDIFQNPDKYGGMNSSLMLINQLESVKLPEQQHAETMKFLMDQAKRVDTFATQFKDITEKHAQENNQILDLEKEAALDRINLEKTKIQAEKEDVMTELREKQARMEGYLKMKLGAQGLTSSASGLSLLMSKVTSFDRMVESTGMKYNLALEELTNQTNEMALKYTNAQIQNKQNAESQVFNIQKMLSDSLSEIEGKGIQSAQQSRLDKANAVNNFFSKIKQVEDDKKANEIEMWKETNRQQEKLLDQSHKLAGLTGTIWSVGSDGEVFDTGILTKDQKNWQTNQMLDIGKYMIKEGGIKGARQVELMMGLAHGALGNDPKAMEDMLDQIEAQAIVGSSGGGGGGSQSEPSTRAFLLYKASLDDKGEIDPSYFESLDVSEQKEVSKVIDYQDWLANNPDVGGVPEEVTTEEPPGFLDKLWAKATMTKEEAQVYSQKLRDKSQAERESEAKENEERSKKAKDYLLN